MTTAPLLTHTLTTRPSHLTASPPTGELSLADLSLLISNPRPEPVRCGRIAIFLPVGTRGADLAETGVGIVATATPHIWSVVAVQEDVLIAVAQNGSAEFPPSEHGREDQPTASLTIRLTGIKINRSEGTAPVRVIETSSLPGQPEAERIVELDVFKGRHPGRARRTTARHTSGTANLSARRGTPAAPDPRPATLVPASTRVVLDWQGPQGEHTLYSTPHPEGIRVTFPHETFPLERDETFLVRTTTGGADRYDSVTVTVSTPVLDRLRAGAVTGAPVPTLDAASVTCTGTVTAAGPARAEKGGTVTGTVTVHTPVTTRGLESAGPVTAAGPGSRLTAGSLEVTGLLQSDDTLEARQGVVRILGEPTVEYTQGVQGTARTDGFLIASGESANLRLSLQAPKDAKAYDSAAGYSGHSTAALPVSHGDGYTGHTVFSPDGNRAQYIFHPIGEE
ncbi:hypothetical protein ACQEVS_00570 [Streptomyces sp. CA-181903]|uniref:hypothetical protein n=1 Tax=Streptomyces sp. CA-181903 TaxID=3240055 RepID=UPI003D907971